MIDRLMLEQLNDYPRECQKRFVSLRGFTSMAQIKLSKLTSMSTKVILIVLDPIVEKGEALRKDEPHLAIFPADEKA